MKPNWSALAALGRTLFILFASVFVGALVLPLAADGSLPVSWAAWRPVLSVALGAAIAAEIAWLRQHLSAAASALGLGPTAPAAPSAPSAVVAAAVKVTGVLALLVIGVALLAACGGSAPSPVEEAEAASYGGNQLLCVQRGGDQSQIDACRDAVKSYWCASDGGPLAAAAACSHVRLSDGAAP